MNNIEPGSAAAATASAAPLAAAGLGPFDRGPASGRAGWLARPPAWCQWDAEHEHEQTRPEQTRTDHRRQDDVLWFSGPSRAERESAASAASAAAAKKNAARR